MKKGILPPEYFTFPLRAHILKLKTDYDVKFQIIMEYYPDRFHTVTVMKHHPI
jgi:hypothetical protein